MHDLFNTPYGFNTGVSNLTGWNHARRTVYDELNKLARYFRESTVWVKNTHPLVKLLRADDTTYYNNADNIIEVARERWIKDAQLFGISTPHRRVNNLAENILYPNNIVEYLAMDDSLPMGNEIKLSWQQLEPVRVLDHPYADLNMSIPNGRFVGDPVMGGAAYICINIPVLILQYRLWQRYEAERSGINPDSPSIFLSRYPLFNVINSHMDITIRNRFINFYNQREPAPFKRLMTGGVAINDTANLVDRSLLHLVKIISSQKLTFDGVNQQVPQLSVSNMQQSLVLPEMSYTRSVRWVYDASRLTWLNFLVQYNNDQNISLNRQYIDQIRRRLQQMKTDREFYPTLRISEGGVYGELAKLVGV